MKRYFSKTTGESATLVKAAEEQVILLLENGETKVMKPSTLRRWWKQSDETVESISTKAESTDDETAYEAIKGLADKTKGICNDEPVTSEKAKAAEDEHLTIAKENNWCEGITNSDILKMAAYIEKQANLYGGTVNTRKTKGAATIKLGTNVRIQLACTNKSITFMMKSKYVQGVTYNYRFVNMPFDARIKYEAEDINNSKKAAEIAALLKTALQYEPKK